MKKRWSNRAKAIKRLINNSELSGNNERAVRLKLMLKEELGK